MLLTECIFAEHLWHAHFRIPVFCLTACHFSSEVELKSSVVDGWIGCSFECMVRNGVDGNSCEKGWRLLAKGVFSFCREQSSEGGWLAGGGCVIVVCVWIIQLPLSQ